jgi:phage baseplate assembly protein W
MLKYYSIPLDFGRLCKRAVKHDKTDPAESVIQHIYLILSASYGSSRFDYDYGCVLTAYDFENPGNVERIKHQLEKSVKDLLVKYEKRLGDIKLNIQIKEEDINTQGILKIRKMKKKVEINISATLLALNRPFQPPPFVIYLSPIAINKKNS